MTLSGILTVLWFALKPWLWLIILALVVLVAAQLAGRRKGYRCLSTQGRFAWIFGPILGLIAFFVLPSFFNSQMGYVQTSIDWLALIGGSLAVAVYALMVLRPLCHLRSCKR